MAAYERDAQPIASMRFARLPLYFDHTSLETAKFILIDRVPMPPLSAWGWAGLRSLGKAISMELLIWTGIL
jgi:hypothetical protein